MILIITGGSKCSSSWGHQDLQSNRPWREKWLAILSSCLEGLGALGTGQTGKLPRAATALTYWDSIVPQGQASCYFWKG